MNISEALLLLENKTSRDSADIEHLRRLAADPVMAARIVAAICKLQDSGSRMFVSNAYKRAGLVAPKPAPRQLEPVTDASTRDEALAKLRRLRAQYANKQP